MMEHRTALGLFLAVTTQRPTAALTSRPSTLPSGKNGKGRENARSLSRLMSSTASVDLVDVDANLLHPALMDDVDHHIKVASSVGVKQFVVPGSTLEDSKGAIELALRNPNRVIIKAHAKFCPQDHPSSCASVMDSFTSVVQQPVIFPTAGVHPYYVEECGPLDDAMAALSALAQRAEVRCVGECGLDFSEGFPPAERQLPWFERQVQIACQLKKPLFLHERLAAQEFTEVLKKYDASHGLPPCLVHCFTGTAQELSTYLEMGFYVGITGFICKEKHGEALRDMVKDVPLNRLMVETDAPYLGFPGCREGYAKPKQQNPNVPSALPKVVHALAKEMGTSYEDVARRTTANSHAFFQMST